MWVAGASSKVALRFFNGTEATLDIPLVDRRNNVLLPTGACFLKSVETSQTSNDTLLCGFTAVKPKEATQSFAFVRSNVGTGLQMMLFPTHK